MDKRLLKIYDQQDKVRTRKWALKNPQQAAIQNVRQLKKLLAKNLSRRAATLNAGASESPSKKANRRKSRKLIMSNNRAKEYEDTAVNMSMISSMHSLNEGPQLSQPDLPAMEKKELGKGDDVLNIQVTTLDPMGDTRQGDLENGMGLPQISSGSTISETIDKLQARANKRNVDKSPPRRQLTDQRQSGPKSLKKRRPGELAQRTLEVLDMLEREIVEEYDKETKALSRDKGWR